MSDIWGNLKHFSKDEAWGDPERMNHSLLLQLDYFREASGVPFVVTNGFDTSGHVTNSYHYSGRAVDGRFVEKSGKVLSLREHIILALKSPFGGIGIYTWSARGPFVHFDNRNILGERKIWVCEKQGSYTPFTSEFLSLHFS
jgi:uncharacterized protein YcbK (DUF882 family)